ncbi:hypothetical protein PQX77_011136 [Marasmius sp. AFHP31]|nr:hypothetical protein PQX77_011136 [Marasmius sp. AFHP31]
MLPIIENLPPPNSKNPSQVGTPAGRASTPVTLPEQIKLINRHYYLWQGGSDKHRWAYRAKNNKTIFLDQGVVDGSLALTIPYDPQTTSEGDTIDKPPAPEDMPAGPSNMSSTRTEMKIETKMETQKGKGQVAPRGEEPPRPSTPPDDPGGSDNEQGSNDGKGSDSWRSASVKEPLSFKGRGRKPDVFTGKREEVEDFLMEFSRYLCLKEAIYPSMSNKIDLMLSFIKHVWTGGTAEQKLDSLRQTGDLADINEFNKAFNKLAGDSEHNNAGLKLFYEQGINPALKATIDRYKVVPTTLDGWQKAAIQKYNDWVRSKAEENAWGRRKLTTTSSTTTTTIRAANT